MYKIVKEKDNFRRLQGGRNIEIIREPFDKIISGIQGKSVCYTMNIKTKILEFLTSEVSNDIPPLSNIKSHWIIYQVN